MTLSLITVTHRSRQHLPGFVASFLSHAGASAGSIEFVVVENSGDSEIEELLAPLREAGFAVRFLTTANDGFGAGCNAGAAAAGGNVLVFANPDIRFIGELAPLERLQGGWGTAIQLDDRHRPYAFDLLLEHKSIRGELRRHHRSLTPPPPHMLDRIYPVGSFFAVDRLMFQRSGGFDERFFLYHEEAELARRLHRLAGPPQLIDEVRVRHTAFGSQASTDATLRHEMDGFFRYVAITGARKAVAVRLVVLALASATSAKARFRLRLMLRRLMRQGTAR